MIESTTKPGERSKAPQAEVVTWSDPQQLISDFHNLSLLVPAAWVRFELTERFPVRRFSRPLHSTTLPPRLGLKLLELYVLRKKLPVLSGLHSPADLCPTRAPAPSVPSG